MGSLDDIVETAGSYAKGVSMNFFLFFTLLKKKTKHIYIKKRVIERYRQCLYLGF